MAMDGGRPVIVTLLVNTVSCSGSGKSLSTASGSSVVVERFSLLHRSDGATIAQHPAERVLVVGELEDEMALGRLLTGLGEVVEHQPLELVLLLLGHLSKATGGEVLLEIGPQLVFRCHRSFLSRWYEFERVQQHMNNVRQASCRPRTAGPSQSNSLHCPS